MRRFFADLRDSKFFLIVIEKLGRYNEESSECDYAVQERRDVAGYCELLVSK
jgi:hypothetical protein